MNSHDITTLQQCPRKLVIERQNPALKKVRPSVVYDNLLSQAMLRTKESCAVISESEIAFRAAAISPGLETSHDTWKLTQDWLAILRNSISYFDRYSKLVLSPVHRMPDAGPGWEPTCLMEDSGLMLHRFVAVSDLGDETIMRETQSWATVGDIVEINLPMRVHFIKIGVARNNHQHSPWSKIYTHPAIKGRYAFQKKDGTKLDGGWQYRWFSDLKVTTDEWLDMLRRDNVELTRTIEVEKPGPRQIEIVRKDIERETCRANSLPILSDIPLHRVACNMPTPCQWKRICYEW